MEFGSPIQLSPEEFELFVKECLEASGRILTSFKAEHRAKLSGSDGDYEIDIMVKFEALDSDFLVLIECKQLERKVERREVQILHSKMQSLHAQKGMLFASSGFQQGALDFATAHGIALIQVRDGKSTCFTRSFDSRTEPPRWIKSPKYCGWLRMGRNLSVMSGERGEYTRRFLDSGTDTECSADLNP